MRILQLLTLALPWIAIPGVASPYLEVREFLLLAGCWTLLLWTWFKQPIVWDRPGNPWTVWVALWLIGTGLLHFQYPFLVRQPGQAAIVYNVYTWLPTINVLLIILTVSLLSRSILLGVGPQLLAQWCCLSVGLVSAYAWLQHAGLDQFYVAGGTGHRWHTVASGFGNPEHAALYVASLLPLCWLFRPRRYLLYLALGLSLLVLTYVPGTWLVAAIGFLTYATCRLEGRKRWALLAVAIVLAGFAAPHVWTRILHDERWSWWQQAWQLLQFRDATANERFVPSITGYGLGSLAILWHNTPVIWVHNEWLQLLVETGIVGAGLTLAMAWWTIQRGWVRAQTSLIDAGWFSVWMAWLGSTVIFPTAHWAHTVWPGLCAWAVLEREER